MDPTPRSQSFKVGELARRTGVSVRTLHHYDEIGLLAPSRRSASGHRLYGEADVVRLLRIRSLVALGMSLDEIGGCLAQDGFSAERVLELQIGRLREQIAHAGGLCQRLESLLVRVRMDGGASVGEFLETLEAMSMFEKYYTKEQLAELHARGQQLGAEKLREVEAEWPKLIASVRSEMQKGTDPKDPRVQALARRWKELLAMFTGGDPAIARAAGRVIQEEPHARERTGLDAEILSYVQRASG
ncbi:MAG: MerR family transcriptional regulator [Planctomycetota bacterium]